MNRLTMASKNILRAILPFAFRQWFYQKRRRLKHLLLPLRRVRNFDRLRRVTPIDRDYGDNRGQCIDRYYIERFLAAHAPDIHGRVLEIQDNYYTYRFGGNRVTKSDVLDILESNPKATIVADLNCANHIPSVTFDCIICPQTLLLIFDVRAAIQTLYRILKPDGVLLVTIPGVAHKIASNEIGDYWRFTSMSARRLFQEAFPPENVEVEAYGNVLVAISFLHGLALEELRQDELDYFDPEYEVSITVRAVKPESRS
jgi:SAM-dependent methyltransferase